MTKPEKNPDRFLSFTPQEWRVFARLLCETIKNKNTGALIQCLDKGFDLSDIDNLGFNPLTLAVERLNHEAIPLLIKAGCSPNRVSSQPISKNPYYVAINTQRYAALGTLLTYSLPTGEVLEAVLNLLIEKDDAYTIERLDKCKTFHQQTQTLKNVLEHHKYTQNKAKNRLTLILAARNIYDETMNRKLTGLLPKNTPYIKRRLPPRGGPK